MSVDNGKDVGLIPASEFLKEDLRSHPNALEIPAAPGKEPVTILPKAAYFKANHGQHIVDYPKNADWPTHRPTKDAYYAVYMFETPGKQIRFITAPVALVLDDYQYNRDLLADMEAQGFDPKEVKKHCDLPDVEDVFGYLRSRQLPDLRKMMQEKAFVTSGYHIRAGTYIDSGWKSLAGHERLDIVGRETVISGARMNPYYTGSPIEKYPTGVHAISKPLDINTTNALEKEIYAKVLQANAVSTG